MRTEKEIRAKISEIELKLRAFCGEHSFLGKAPIWFQEGLKNQISLLEWVLNDIPEKVDEGP